MTQKNRKILIFIIMLIGTLSIWLLEFYKFRILMGSFLAGILGYITILIIEKKRPKLGNLSGLLSGFILFGTGSSLIFFVSHPMGFYTNETFILLPIGPALVGFSSAILTDWLFSTRSYI